MQADKGMLLELAGIDPDDVRKAMFLLIHAKCKANSPSNGTAERVVGFGINLSDFRSGSLNYPIDCLYAIERIVHALAQEPTT
jgi:hypothetical protein